jgi:menaquinone-9 beta-reductase
LRYKHIPPSTPNPLDVFIIGGGPAGLATAMAARQRGLTVAVADGLTPLIDKACGEGLLPDGIDALRQLGISLSAADVHPFRGIRFLSGAHSAEAEFSNTLACGIRRTTLHRILIDRATDCGVTMLWQSPVEFSRSRCILADGRPITARWIVGADGSNSRVRRWIGLDPRGKAVRYGFRRHYCIAPWTDFMELHWGRESQIYVTPVSREEVCVALVSSSLQVRLDRALAEFPQLAGRLANAPHASGERGSVTVSRKLRRVYRGRTVLVGDASGGVDAITGEGLCLAFRQAMLLADCLVANDLGRYQREHARLMRRPALMARLMLLLARHERLRRRAMRVFESQPRSFAKMLAMHVGDASARDYITNGVQVGWQFLRA